MNIQHLVAMANQIAANFEDWPNRHDACLEVTTHLKRFWDPRMRQQIVEYVKKGDSSDVRPLAAAAIRLLE